MRGQLIRKTALRPLILIGLLLPASGLLSAASRPPVRGANGMVVTASPPASRVGIEILRQGGNAVDAAVAVGFALAVTYPTAGNLGGGGLMIIHDAISGTSTATDYREKAPVVAHRDLYSHEEGNVAAARPTDGHLAVAVPGPPAGRLRARASFAA